MMSFLAVSATLALPFLGGVNAFWRMNCANIHTGRVDPIVNPGTYAAHAHTIVGPSNIGVNATYNSLLNSACTSCELSADKSAYWSPLLYYQYPNGSFIDVPHGGAVLYYLTRGPTSNNTIPFPKGFMMLSGDKAARSYDNVTMTYGTADYPGRHVADRISFACLQEQPNQEQPWMFNTSCINGLRAQVHFQSCWNGKDLYKADNSHVAYQSGIDNGICPPTHPYQIPHIFMEVNYAVSQVPDLANNPGGQYVFSQGDPTGYGFHADFQNGWDMAVQTQAVQQCLGTNNDGQIDECPPLQAVDSNGYNFNCPQQPSQIGEPSTGLIDKLPGCIQITYGPAAAPASAMNCPSTVVQAPIYRTVDSTPRATNTVAPGHPFGLNNQVYLGCYNDSAGGIRTLNAYSFVNYTAMTVEFCQKSCNAKGYRLSGVEYAQECHCGNIMMPYAIGGQNQCTWNCGGTMTSGGTQEICGGYAYISVYNNTDPSFVANGSEVSSNGASNPYAPLDPYGPTYLGCASDSSGVRALSATQYTDDANMTVENCRDFCTANNGYQYYGVEYSYQCYCGNALNPPSTILNATSTPKNDTCNMRCIGNNNQMCGGPGAMSLYNNTAFIPPKAKSPIGKYVAKGCLTEGTNGRALQGDGMTNANMTNEMCVKYCLGKRYHYAGVEFGQECYCSNSISYSTGATAISCPIGQLMLCKGNIYEYCGGSGLLNLYYSATL